MRLLFLLPLLTAPLLANFRTARVFTDHMVLQRGMENPVWGQGAAPNATVTASLRDASAALATASTRADSQGRWRLRLPIPNAPVASPLTLTIASDNASLTLADVLVGDVWLCAGQSNLTHAVAHNADTDTSRPYSHKSKTTWRLPDPNPALDSGIRHFGLERKIPANFNDPLDDFIPDLDNDPAVENTWKRATPETAGEFTAIGFYFARAWRAAKLRSGQNIPVGLLRVGWGGTRIESWLDARTLASRPDFAARRAELAGSGPTPEKLRSNRPSACFNSRVHPLAGLALRGVLWSQGESNSGTHALYRAELPALISSYRKLFQNPDLPFLILQTPSIPRSSRLGENQPYPWLREAQAETARSTPRVFLVSTLPLGSTQPSPNNTDAEIHCRTKHLIAPFAALAARAGIDGENIPAQGPRFLSATFSANAVTATFDTSGAGLATSDNLPPRGFEIADASGRWLKPASVTLGENTVTLSAPGLPDPAGLRYGWSNQGHALSEKSAPDADEYPPTANLSSRLPADTGDRLPMQPFRFETKTIGATFDAPALDDRFDRSPWDAALHSRTLGLRRATDGTVERTRAIATEHLSYRSARPITGFTLHAILAHKNPVATPDPSRLYVSVSNDGENWTLPVPLVLSTNATAKTTVHATTCRPPAGLLANAPTWLRVTLNGSAITTETQTRLARVELRTGTPVEAFPWPTQNKP
ncbi:MAG: sialate O-acetylesterase [Opitutaceae bacterium]|jgi:sialate O-acetylesterase|nr:sialate O-acetylesterase [Opitutaceae bacterium]